MKNFLSQNLIYLRKKRGLTNSQISQDINIPEKNLVAWELETAVPEVEDVMTLSKYYNVDTSDISNVLLEQEEFKNYKTELLNTAKRPPISFGALGLCCKQRFCSTQNLC